MNNFPQGARDVKPNKPPRGDMSDQSLVKRLRSYHPCLVRLGDAGMAGLADDSMGAADLIEALSAEVAAIGAERDALRTALASLHNDMTGAFGRIEAVVDAVASDMRRTMREALSGRVLAGEGCDG